MQGRVSRWGNSLGIRIPKDIIDKIGLAEGMKVEIEAHGAEVVIKRVEPKLRYSLEGLLAGFTPELRRELRVASAEVDLGPDVGREVVDE
jgi:antitoxin MazE